jgi:hypothetical protein
VQESLCEAGVDLPSSQGPGGGALCKAGDARAFGQTAQGPPRAPAYSSDAGSTSMVVSGVLGVRTLW